MGRLIRSLRSLANWAITLFVVMLIIVLGELLPPLRALDAYLSNHPTVKEGLTILAGGMALLGTLTLALTQFLPAPRRPRGMGEAEVQAPPMELEESRGSGWQTFAGEASFAAMKAAWRRRSWRYHRRWRDLFVMMGGACLLLIGLFGLFFVIGPPGIKLLALLVVAYAVGMTVWAFWRA
jgi:hypothetical protein